MNNYKLKKFHKNYINDLTESLNNIDFKNVDKACNLILKTINLENNIFVCGNGGSAAIANHYVCDYLKYFREKTKKKPRIISLSNSIETITAISNDKDYKHIFSYQIESLYKKDDIIIIISSSGNSKNIREIVKFSKKNKLKTIGFSGFKGGYLKKNSTIPIHININNYGLVEDAHHILMHLLMQYLIKNNK